MIPRERGTKGAKYFYSILFSHLVFSGKSGYMSFLGEATCCIIAWEYVNHVFSHLRVFHSFCSSFEFMFTVVLGLGMENEFLEVMSHG
jgi:hypothetical protein